MSMELGLIIILFIGMILNVVVDYMFESFNDLKIKQLDDHNCWQDRERERLRERIVEIEKRMQEMEERDK